MSMKEIVDRFFELSEDFIYVIIAVILMASALFLIYHTLLTFTHFEGEGEVIRWVVEILDRALLMLMIVEVLYTVRLSFKEHVLRAEPFLVVALIASIRRILVISVESAYMLERFNQHMIEIGILGVLIFIFVLAIVILRKFSVRK